MYFKISSFLLLYSFSSTAFPNTLTKNVLGNAVLEKEYRSRKEEILKYIGGSNGVTIPPQADGGTLNEVLYTDMHLVLPNDMLTKVDMMSMANSLEVRTPFLDYNVVDFAFSLPAESKINKKVRKKIVRDAFRELLPV